MAFYGEKEYWDKRYTLNPHPYEWYQGYVELKEVLSAHIQKGSRVMVAGCGNSTLGEEMYDHSSFTDVTCVDFSEPPIAIMRARMENRQGLHYVCNDLRELTMPAGTFDCVLDKATLDSCLCGSDDTAIQRSATRMLSEIYRVLKVGGIFLCISHTAPAERRVLYNQDLNWDITVEHLPKEGGVGTVLEEYEGTDSPNYFLYVCKKQPPKRKESIAES
eukprot:TRINITY_DN33930_c0_g1_i1.p1 TRINITY_DN33930_c0_g1~~TRINITY_DN33930_c0_g1_i1.p1  ORF type:complete len:218 (+),score=51.93 TRINITY_DN33930_c0_g1_i1:35-688(+)